ncbi:MAG TPA: ParB/RepB/Spo0J family partition protein, partial [Candidatus Thermoplasmatota archaeon]|nr:ParB/RepB/Spo0J family partition protein [Candidatus Thermoplasmatota archaeon]
MPKKSIARKPRSTTASQRDLGTLLFEKGARDDSAELVYLDVAKIDEDPNNARRTYDKAGLEALAESIRSNGLLEPVIVRAHPDDKGRYMLTAGSRRLRAHKLLGRKEIKAIVETGRSAAGVRSASAVENLQREQLHPHEEARAFQGMLDQGMTQEQVAAAAGVGL